MSKLPLPPPEHLKQSLQVLMPAQLGSDTLDIYEIELFDSVNLVPYAPLAGRRASNAQNPCSTSKI